MKPAPFAYHAPRRLEEALALLGALPEAKLLAGGQSLIPMMNFRLARPQHLVDLARVDGLASIRAVGERIEIGAMTRQAAVETSAVVRDGCPLLVDALRHVGHYASRTRGTIGGSLAHADPASELPVVASALDAELVVAGPGVTRAVAPAEFFRAPLTVALDRREILTAVSFARIGPRVGWGFTELNRRHGGFAIVCVAAVLEVDGAGRCTKAAVALGGVAGVPVRSAGAEAGLLGHPLDDRRIDAAAAAVAGDIDPGSDLHASAEYRREMAQAFTRRALVQARGRFQEGR